MLVKCNKAEFLWWKGGGVGVLINKDNIALIIIYYDLLCTSSVKQKAIDDA